MKKCLNIPTIDIGNVFTSKVNPILSQFNKIFEEGDIPDTSYIKNSESYEMMKNLQSRSGLTDKMEKYKQLHRKVCPC